MTDNWIKKACSRYDTEPAPLPESPTVWWKEIEPYLRVGDRFVCDGPNERERTVVACSNGVVWRVRGGHPANDEQTHGNPLVQPVSLRWERMNTGEVLVKGTVFCNGNHVGTAPLDAQVHRFACFWRLVRTPAEPEPVQVELRDVKPGQRFTIDPTKRIVPAGAQPFCCLEQSQRGTKFRCLDGWIKFAAIGAYEVVTIAPDPEPTETARGSKDEVCEAEKEARRGYCDTCGSESVELNPENHPIDGAPICKGCLDAFYREVADEYGLNDLPRRCDRCNEPEGRYRPLRSVWDGRLARGQICGNCAGVVERDTSITNPPERVSLVRREMTPAAEYHLNDELGVYTPSWEDWMSIPEHRSDKGEAWEDGFRKGQETGWAAAKGYAHKLYKNPFGAGIGLQPDTSASGPVRFEAFKQALGDLCVRHGVSVWIGGVLESHLKPCLVVVDSAEPEAKLQFESKLP